MQLQAILNRVEKQKGFVFRNPRFAIGGSEILIDIQPHGRSRPVCSGCGKKGPGHDTLSQRRFEFVPLWAIPVAFLYCIRIRWVSVGLGRRL
jgi:transposase